METDASGQKPSRVVAFGSCVERKMFPTHHAPTRFGIEQGLRGEPHRSPGCYGPDTMSLFLQPMDARPKSTRGWYFGATTASRSPRSTHLVTKPGPADYQRVRAASLKEMYKPFNAACERMSEDNRSKEVPGPGAYDHDVVQSRHVEFDESFGSGRSLKNIVTVKCTKGVPEECRKCHQMPVGEYYENRNYTLCPKCYTDIAQSEPTKSTRLHGFHKVRDCRAIHNHQFPGKEPKTLLMSEKDQKKQRYREAYMRLYYT